MKDKVDDNTSDHRINLVGDNPSATDEFAGGAHKRIAQAIVDTVCTQEGGKAIGLEGTWGSGKSTVVEIIQDLLKQSDKNKSDVYYVFTFDAWAHQGDSLRRSFLEELINKLVEDNVLSDRKKWQEVTNRIQARIKKTETRSVPNLNWLAKLSIFIAPLLPLVYLWLSPFAFKPPISEYLDILMILAFIILSVPYLAVLLVWIFGDKEKKNKSIMAWFDRSTDEIITEQLIRNEEPTTIEFNKIFDDVIKDVSNKDKKLIIVLDNLDRLPPDLIRNTWATMRNFFATAPSSQREKVLKNVWLIVPFDRDYMEEVFYQGIQNQQLLQSEQAPEKQRHAQDVKNRPTKGFIEKTFQVIFRVSPPLLSHWRDYLENQLYKVFADILKKKDHYKIFKLLEFHFSSNSGPVTPRSIKSFVNSLATQYRQWGDIISIENQALYVLNKDKISVDVRSLREAKLLDERTASFMSGTDWPKYLAAAHFNVEPDQAYEVLLVPEIERSLISGDIESLIELQENNGFDLSLTALIEDKANQWAKEEPKTFAEVCYSLNELDLKDKLATKENWRKLAQATDHLGQWTSFSDKANKGISALIKNTELHESIFSAKGLVKSISSSENGENIIRAKEWTALLDTAATTLKQKDHIASVTKIFQGIPIPGNAEFIVSVASACHKAKTLDFSKLQISSVEPSDIAQRIIQFVQEEALSADLLPTAEVFLTANNSCDWSQVIPQIQKRLQTNQPNLSSKEFYILLKILRLIADSGEGNQVNNIIAQLADNGTLLGILGHGLKEENNELIAMSVWLLIKKHEVANVPNPGNHQAYGNLNPSLTYYNNLRQSPNEHKDIVKDISSLAGSDGEFNLVLELALPDTADRELFRAVLCNMVTKKNYNSLRVRDIFTNYNRLAAILGEELEDKFLQQFDGWLQYVDEAFSGEHIRALTTRFIKKSKENKTKIGKKVLNIAYNYFKATSKENWEKYLKEESDDIRLLVDLINEQVAPKLAGPFREALKDVTEDIIQGTVEPTNFVEQWHVLPNALQSSSRSAFYRDIYTLLVHRAPAADTTRKVLSFYDPGFSENAPLVDQANDTIHFLVAPLLGEGHTDGLKWIENNVNIISNCVKKAKKEEKDLLNETIDGISERDDIDIERVKNIAQHLGLNTKKLV